MQTKKILLIEDEDSIRLIAQIGLEDRPNWQVLSAATGAEGLILAAEEKPDLILLDVMMPGMDGKTTLAKLRENPITARIPVIFVTAKAQKHELEAYTALGVAGVIIKPFDPTRLSKEIEQLVASLCK